MVVDKSKFQHYLPTCRTLQPSPPAAEFRAVSSSLSKYTLPRVMLKSSGCSRLVALFNSHTLSQSLKLNDLHLSSMLQSRAQMTRLRTDAREYAKPCRARFSAACTLLRNALQQWLQAKIPIQQNNIDIRNTKPGSCFAMVKYSDLTYLTRPK